MSANTSPIREFHLFAGIGGGIYGGHLLGHECCAGVEINDFCKKVLGQRQQDGWLKPFPIYDDITKLDGEEFKGSFDVLCGGFPCQAFSHAAHGKNIAEKNLWSYMLDFVSKSEAPIVFGENVVFKAIFKAKEDLEDLGYKVTMCRLSCKDLGADHQRNRFWLMAVKDMAVFKKLAQSIEALPKFCGGVWTQNPNEIEYPAEVTDRRKQLTGIGNAQSPLVAAVAFRILTKRHLLKNFSPDNASEAEISNEFVKLPTWINKKYGIVGGIHTPTTMANYACKSMMKHSSCVNFVKIFGNPEPLNGEYLMGMPIGITSPNPVSSEQLKTWTLQTYTE